MIEMIKNRWKLISIFSIGIGILLVILGLLLGGSVVYSIGYNRVDKWHITTSDGMIDETKERVVLEKTKVDAFEKLEASVNFADINILEGDDFYIEYISADGELDYSFKKGIFFC